jgi:hypothetical protein
MAFRPCLTHCKEDLRPRDFDPRPCSSKYIECHICKNIACFSRFYQCTKCGLIGAACHSSEPPYFWKTKDNENNFDDIITLVEDKQEQKQEKQEQEKQEQIKAIDNPLDAYFATRFKLSFLC